MSVIVQLRSSQCAREECNWTYLGVWTLNREDGGDGIVGGVSLYDYWHIGDPMGKDRGGGEGAL